MRVPAQCVSDGEVSPAAATAAERGPAGLWWLARLVQQEDLNFLLTNRLPRQAVTRFVGWFSRIENPLVCRASLAVWKVFAGGLDLGEARKTRFTSVHDCFIRQLKEGARPIDRDESVAVSPCDAIVGAHGSVRGTEVIQAKGFPYTLDDLLGDRELVERHRDGIFVTLRLRSSMYHRFHAPCEGTVSRVTYISGDTWNVNPIALRRVERLFCKNERAAIELVPADGAAPLTLVAVAAVGVACIRLHCLGEPLDLEYAGPRRIDCDRPCAKGDELGWFELGSTIIVFASQDFALCGGVSEGSPIRMGEPLMVRRSHPTRTGASHG